MTKTMCPITKDVCYMASPLNDSDNEDDWVSCAFEDSLLSECKVEQTLESVSRMADKLAGNFWKDSEMPNGEYAFGIFHTNSAE